MLERRYAANTTLCSGTRESYPRDSDKTARSPTSAPSTTGTHTVLVFAQYWHPYSIGTHAALVPIQYWYSYSIDPYSVHPCSIDIHTALVPIQYWYPYSIDPCSIDVHTVLAHALLIPIQVVALLLLLLLLAPPLPLLLPTIALMLLPVWLLLCHKCHSSPLMSPTVNAGGNSTLTSPTTSCDRWTTQLR